MGGQEAVDALPAVSDAQRDPLCHR